MRTDKQIVCSFSGGETSGDMAIKLKYHYPDTLYVYANTGQETEATLEFVEMVDKFYGLGVVWIEAVINTEKGKGTGYKIVDFESASRNGEPFESMCSVYGLPGPNWPHCSRELKTVPLKKWADDNFDDYVFAIGIREDEIDRINSNYEKLGLVYPSAFWWPTTKPEVNRFWRDQPERLNLKGYQGNCKWCWKKANSKHYTILEDNPEHYDFPKMLEEKYSEVNLQDYETEPRRMFRKYRNVDDLIKEAGKGFIRADDDSIVYEYQQRLFTVDDDDLDACGSESCEAF